MGAGMSWAMVMMLAVSSGQVELLDCVPTDAYWQKRQVTVTPEAILGLLKAPAAQPPDIGAMAKELGDSNFQKREAATKKIIDLGPAVLPQVRPLARSEDPEVAKRAQQIISALTVGAGARSVDLLMAIRTLGELKNKEALPALEKMLDAKEPFVADYARRAVARINGKAVEPRKPDAKAMREDLLLLPSSCGLVAQMAVRAQQAVSMEKAIEGLGPLAGGGNKEDIIKKANEEIISILDRVGNMRLDGITLGAADNIGHDTGFVAVVGRGGYDPALVRAVLIESGFKASTIDGLEAITSTTGEHMALVMPSADRIIFMIGPSQEQLPLKEFAAAVKAGKGTLEKNEEMARLLKGLETGDTPIWAAAVMSDAYRKAGVLTPFDSITLVSRQDQGVIKLTVAARGKDAEKVQVAVKEFDDGVAEARKDIGRMVEMMPAMKPAAALLESIKTESSGAGATVTAELKDASPASFLLMFFGTFVAKTSAQAIPAVAPAPPVGN
ncbi:MAG: HEAT repeat domain-containing protein [Phycisphaerae bacterium]